MLRDPDDAAQLIVNWARQLVSGNRFDFEGLQFQITASLKQAIAATAEECAKIADAEENSITVERIRARFPP